MSDVVGRINFGEKTKYCRRCSDPVLECNEHSKKEIKRRITITVEEYEMLKEKAWKYDELSK